MRTRTATIKPCLMPWPELKVVLNPEFRASALPLATESLSKILGLNLWFLSKAKLHASLTVWIHINSKLGRSERVRGHMLQGE